MTVGRYDISADLGTGSFAVDRLTVTSETAVTEVPLITGSFSRAVTGSRLTLVLEGRYSITRDSTFFSSLLAALKGTVITNAVIGGVTYPSLYSARAVLSRNDESGIGSFTITMKEF